MPEWTAAKTITYVSLLTPPGRGALATIVARGPVAWAITQSCLVEPIPLPNETRPARPWLRQFKSEKAASEEVVVSFPHVEEARLHCHGGIAACEAVLQALVERGAVRIDWQDWASAERVALAGALTERTALILFDQCQGALERELAAIDSLIAESKKSAALARINRLLTRAPIGLHCTQPWRVVIAGRPNAGKSSLLNALLGFQRAITNEQPGTTRDVVTARTAFAGWPVELRDTAGLRSSSEPLEAAGVELAQQELAAADLVLYVIPAGDSPEKVSRELATALDRSEPRQLLVVRSKSDLCSASASSELLVSALQGQGLAELIEAIVKRLIGTPPEVGEAVPFRAEQVERLEALANSLQSHDSHRQLSSKDRP